RQPASDRDGHDRPPPVSPLAQYPMSDPELEPPPYRWAFATFLLVLLIYVATLAPTTAFWDTSEYIAAAKVLGIPHPPGNPLFVILAHSFGLLPLSESY